MTNMTPEKYLYLDNEMLIAKKYIDFGLNELNNLIGGVDENHLCFYLLSNGFERFMKCIICFWHFDKYSCFPEVIEYRHDLVRLKDKIVDITEEKNYVQQKPAFNKDIIILKENELLKKTLILLKELGRISRYYNFDKLLDSPLDYEDPNKKIEDIEKDMCDIHIELKQLVGKIDKNGELDKKLNQEWKKIFNFFSRALTRISTNCNFGKEADRASTHFYDFLSLSDDDCEILIVIN